MAQVGLVQVAVPVCSRERHAALTVAELGAPLGVVHYDGITYTTYRCPTCGSSVTRELAW